jgi:hypothetical protein
LRLCVSVADVASPFVNADAPPCCCHKQKGADGCPPAP